VSHVNWRKVVAMSVKSGHG